MGWTVTFESQLVQCFNELYNSKKIAALCYKLPMIRYRQQGFDIYCDSRHYEHYLAIECKSIDAEMEQKLYFSQYFHHVKGVHQLEYETQIVNKSGRSAFLAVELRKRRGIRKSAYLTPWSVVMLRYSRGDKGLSQDEIMRYVELDYYKQGYHITDDVYEKYLAQLSSNQRITLSQRLVEPKK